MSGNDGWIKMQEKTFTRWMNTYLKQRNLEVSEGKLAEEVGDGVKLCNLFEVIGKESCKTLCKQKVNMKPKMRIQMLENQNLAIKYLQLKDIKLVNVGANDLCDGNLKIILGMIWTVILRFEISEDGKQGLLVWCQRCTKGYDNVDVQNFDRSWNDGLALCALIHHHRPDLIDFDSLDKSDHAGNMELAFKVAEEDLGIERLLDVDDVCDNPKPDDKSMIAYLTQFYKLFASAMKNDNYIKAIERAVAITRRHEKLIESYQPASELKDWMSGKVTAFTDAPLPTNTADTQHELDDFYKYKESEKPQRQGQLMELEGINAALQSSCKNNDRPQFVAAEGLAPDALEGSWAEMEVAENAHEVKLRDQYAKFQEVDFKINKFKAKAKKMEQWAATNQGRFDKRAFDSQDVGVVQAETMVDQHAIFDSQLEQYKVTLAQLLGLVAEISEVPQHEDVAGCVEESKQLEESMKGIESAAEVYKGELLLKLEKERKLADTLKNTLKDGDLLLFAMEEVEEAIDEPVVGNSASACEAQLEQLNGPIANKIQEIENQVKATGENVAVLKEGGRTNGIRPELLMLVSDPSRIQLLNQKHNQRRHKMVTQQAAEEQKEKLRKQFAEIAKDIKEYCTAQQNAVEGIGGDLREQLAAVEDMIEKHGAPENQSKMEQAEEGADKCASIGIVINPHTPETIHSLRALWAELTKTFNRTREQLQEQVLAEEGSKLTPEQLKEIREVFSVFDVDNNNSLTLKEFSDGCEGMGLGLTDEEAEGKFHGYAAGGEKVTFEQFTDFMLKELETGSTQPDVLNAFKNLSGGEFITSEQIAQQFRNKETAQYLETNMPAGGAEGEKDYVAFCPVLFSK